MSEESSVSEMSQSVQSAWEDLVVENPNRRKLEACLVSTIMIVVVCIMGLLLFVVIELQPANNLRKVQRRPNVVFCDNGTCPEFAHRVLGWINFRVKPCVDFHAWVCQSRLKDNPEDTFQQDPERAGTYAANAHFYNMFMRNRDYERNTAKKVNEQAFSHLVGLFDVCVHGLGKVKGESPIKTFLFNTLWDGTVLRGFAGASQVSKFMDLQVQLIRDYNFHPFGRIMRMDQNWVFGSPGFLGTMEQVSLAGFKGEFQDAYGALVNKFKVGSRDDALHVLEPEVNMLKAMAIKDLDTDYPSNYVCNPKVKNIIFNELIKRVFDVDVTGKFFARYSSGAAVIAAYDEAGWKSMNLGMFKFMLKLSLFLDEDDPDLLPFFVFASKYEFGSKVLPVKVYRCGTFIENYLRPAMMQFVKHYDTDRLTTISTKIQADLTEFTTKSTEKKSVAPNLKHFKLARGPLSDWGGNLTALQYFYLNDTDAQVTTYFGCSSEFGPFNYDISTKGFMEDIVMLSKTYACNVKAYTSKELLNFPVLGTEPYFDFVSDKMYLPYGFTMPPNFHPYVPGIFHHNAPALYFKITSEVYKMATAKAFEPKKRGGEGAPIFKAIECFRGLVNPKSKNKTGATQIFFDSVAVPMAYTMYRNVLNHAKWDVSKQARVSLIPFFTEGQYFFIQAAQARCEHMDPDPSITYLRKRDGATAADKINLPFAMNNPLFANRFGCAKERPMFSKDALCKSSPSNSLKKETEKEYPGVYY